MKKRPGTLERQKQTLNIIDREKDLRTRVDIIERKMVARDIYGGTTGDGPGVSVPLIFPNPTVTSGEGLWIKHAPQPFSVTVPSGQELNLVDIHVRNTQATTGASQLYIHKIQWEGDGIDVGAAMAIFNSGKSDSIYLNVAGKSGNPSNNNPTGLGVDINKEIASSGERASANSSQQGIQVYDWSTTNQGAGGPRCMLLQKVGNINTEHRLISLRSNRWHTHYLVNTGDGGFDPTQPVVRLSDETTGNTYWSFRAGGDLYFTEGVGIIWDMDTPGDIGYIVRSGDELKFKSGVSGFRFANEADTATRLFIANSGEVTLPTGPLVVGTADVTQGLIKVLGAGGASAEGGEIQLEMADAHDGTYNAWAIDVSGTALRFFTYEGSVVTSMLPTGQVGIGTATPATSAILDLTSTTGALIVPRMTTTQRNALTPAVGMIIWNTTTGKLQVRDGGISWVDLH